MLFCSPSSSGCLNPQRGSLSGSSTVGCCLTRHWTLNKTWMGATSLLFSAKPRQKYYWAAGGCRRDWRRGEKCKRQLQELASVEMWQGGDRMRSFCFSELLSVQFSVSAAADIMYATPSAFITWKATYRKCCSPHILRKLTGAIINIAR